MAETFLKQESEEQRRRYQLTSFWVTRRRHVLAALVLACLVIEGLCILFGVGVLLDSILISRTEERSVVASLARLPEVGPQKIPATPLKQERVSVMNTDDGFVDFLLFVENKNTDWVFEGSYKFVWGSGETAWYPTLLLPDSETPLVAARIAVGEVPRNVHIEFGPESQWRRIDRRIVGADAEDWLKDHLHVEVQNIAYTSIDVEGKARGTSSFQLVNKTAFSFLRPQFVALLTRGPVVVGAYPFVLETLNAGTTEFVSITWPGTPPAATETRVVPLINPFLESSYRPL